MTYLINQKTGRKYKLSKEGNVLWIWQYFGGEWCSVETYEGAMMIAAVTNALRTEVHEGKLIEIKLVEEVI